MGNGRRIVSLLPSATEIVYALGVEEQLVGVTFECDFPARARSEKRVVVGGRDTHGMSPAAIDAYVRTQLAESGDLYHLEEGALADLDPDLVLTQDLCQVCAVATDTVRGALDHLGCRAEVITLDPYTLDEVLETIGTLAEATAVPEAGKLLLRDLRSRLECVAAEVAGLPTPRVAVVEWVDPVFGAGHWMPDMVRAAGGIPVAGHPAARSEPTTWADVRAADPEIVVVSPCGYGLEDAAAQAPIVAKQLPNAAVWAIDGDSLMVRPGPRLIDGVETLAHIIHPDLGPPNPASAWRNH